MNSQTMELIACLETLSQSDKESYAQRDEDDLAAILKTRFRKSLDERLSALPSPIPQELVNQDFAAIDFHAGARHLRANYGKPVPR